MSENQEDRDQIFEYVIVLHPTESDYEDGKRAVIRVQPTCVIAPDIEVAKTKAVMALAKSDGFEEGSEDRLEVAVRPFCES